MYQAFYNSSLKTVEFESGSELEAIDYAAFSGTHIETIKIPAKIKSIGVRAFQNCSALSEVEFENTDANWNLIAYGSTTVSKTITASEIATPSTAATYLKTTYNYYRWEQS